MHQQFMPTQIQFVVKNHEPSCQALDVMAEEMLGIKMPFQACVGEIKLVGLSVLIADVTEVMLLI